MVVEGILRSTFQTMPIYVELWYESSTGKTKKPTCHVGRKVIAGTLFSMYRPLTPDIIRKSDTIELGVPECIEDHIVHVQESSII
jgi:hypothetical protein